MTNFERQQDQHIKQQGKDAARPTEIADDDLEPVVGGLKPVFGATGPTDPTDPCFTAL